MNESISIHTSDGEFSAYVSRPSASPAPAVIVLQEIFGVNPGIRSIADELAQQGFIAICPDLFWRNQRNLSMSESSEADQQHGFALYHAYEMDRGVSDVVACIEAARALPYCTGRVGVTGFCLGGLLTFLTAAINQADAAAAYYGGGTERFLDRAANVRIPLLMHLADEDEYIGKDAQRAIQAALDGQPNTTIHTYPGCHHAFARPGGQHFDQAAASLANQRTYEFLRHHLA